MRNMKKFASLLLALVMVFALAIPAFAAGEGSITIDNAVVGQTYSIYRIFDLESYDAETNAYSYKVNDAWKGFFEEGATGLKYVDINEQGYVTWKEEATDVEQFAKGCFSYALTHPSGVLPIETKTATGNADETTTSVVFSSLDLGYYLVDSTLGTLCSLNTTNPNAVIKEKNVAPTITKEVQEDSSSAWGESNTAEIGDTVNFKITVHAKKGAKHYEVHDKVSEGLTFDVSSVVVKAGSETLVNQACSIKTENLEDDCTFHVVFSQKYLDMITDDTDIVITYSAVLNEKAVISTGSNNNEAKLAYGDLSKTETEMDETKTYTFKFDLVKTDSANKVLDGAKFELYDAKADGNQISLVKGSDGSYRVATEAEANADGFASAIIETTSGQAAIKGLDANTTYWLQETEAPAGYNKLSDRVEVKIENANLDATVADGVWTAGGVHVVNNAGSELPSTGGVGTTLFYVFGGIMMLAAVVLLVTKKRMAA